MDSEQLATQMQQGAKQPCTQAMPSAKARAMAAAMAMAMAVARVMSSSGSGSSSRGGRVSANHNEQLNNVNELVETAPALGPAMPSQGAIHGF